MDELSIIVAIAKNGAIGRKGQLPWSYPEDRARYERITAGHAVIMGRRTWEEQGAPLPGRHNIVVSRSIGAIDAAVRVAPDLVSALVFARKLDPSPFVIGGVRLFEEAMPLVTRVHLTEIPESPEADAFFVLDERPFVEISREITGSGLVFRVLERKPGLLP